VLAFEHDILVGFVRDHPQIVSLGQRREPLDIRAGQDAAGRVVG